MAAFESIVRPVVLPNIRPAPAQKVVSSSATSTADPLAGFAIIHGNPASVVTLSRSTSISISRSNGVESQRRVDQVRVYQVQDGQGQPVAQSFAAQTLANGGSVNKDNYVDIEVTNRLRLKDPNTGTFTRYYRPVQPADNIEILQRNVIYTTTS
jgi:hypothetical protein